MDELILNYGLAGGIIVTLLLFARKYIWPEVQKVVATNIDLRTREFDARVAQETAQEKNRHDEEMARITVAERQTAAFEALERQQAGQTVLMQSLVHSLNNQVVSLNEIQGMLHASYEGQPVGWVTYAEDGHAVDCNEDACSMLGVSREALLGLDMRDPRMSVTYADGTPYPLDNFPPQYVLRSRSHYQPRMIGVKMPGRPDRVLWLFTGAMAVDLGEARALVMFMDITTLRTHLLTELNRAVATELTDMV